MYTKKSKKKQKRLSTFLFVLPAMIFVLIFAYVPMYGILIAFKDYFPGDSILSGTSNWVGISNFARFFEDFRFKQIMANTFLLSFYGFLIGFPLPIIVALLLNAIKSRNKQRFLQTVFYIPHFIAVVVLAGMLYLFFGENGLVNNIAEMIGLSKYSYYLKPEAFRPLFIFSGNWQDFGWSAIIYLAALAGVDPQLHEAAVIDGATRIKRILHIDMPAIMPTISILLILSIGNLMSVGYEKVLLLQTSANISASEIISTYVYKTAFSSGFPDYSYATAIGLFNSIINVLLLIFANKMARRVSENSLW